MFHFGLPSEPLDFEIGTTKTIKRFDKILYLGSGSDALPLPIGKTAVFVDNRGNKGQQEFNQRPSDKAEFILKELIDQAKDVFSILDEPFVEWDTIENRPIAKVLFKWGEMPNLTSKSDTTNLIYLFGTQDTDIGSNEDLKSFSEHVDLIWWCGYDPDLNSFKNIDFKKVALALGWNQICIPEIITKNCHAFYYIQHLRWAYATLKFYPNDPGFRAQYPKGFDFEDLCRLLGCLISGNSLVDFTEWQKQNDLYELNSPFYYMSFCTVDKIYKVNTDPTLVSKQIE